MRIDKSQFSLEKFWNDNKISACYDVIAQIMGCRICCFDGNIHSFQRSPEARRFCGVNHHISRQEQSGLPLFQKIGGSIYGYY